MVVSIKAEISKTDRVREYLIQELRSGRYQKGSVFLSENTLIRRLGICKNTVREAYSSLVSEGLLERIRGKGTFVIGFENRNHPETSIREVHVLAGDPMRNHEDDPFVGAILTGLHAALDPFDWRIRLKCFEAVEDVYNRLGTFEEELNPGDNVILAGFDFPASLTENLVKKGIRVLTIGRPEDERIPFVHSDYRKSMYDTVRMLVSLGHEKIALADRRTSHHPSFEERRQGYIQALSDSGIVPDARLMVEYRGFDISCGDEIWNSLRSCGVKFTAIIIYGDWATLGFLRNASAEKIPIPEELSLISCCNTPLVSGKLLLTRIAACHSELGKAAGNLLMKPADEAGNILVMPRLIQGDTVKKMDAKKGEEI